MTNYFRYSVSDIAQAIKTKKITSIDFMESLISRVDSRESELNVCANFDKPEQLKENISTALKSLNKPVDILVNNSGGPHGGPLIEANEDEFRVALSPEGTRQ